MTTVSQPIVGMQRLSLVRYRTASGPRAALQPGVHLWRQGDPYTRCALKVPVNPKDYQVLARSSADCPSCLKVEARYGW